MREGGAHRGRRGGFSLPELMVVLALAALLILALQQGLMASRHFYEAQRATSDRNESVRFALAVLGASLGEASLPRGDVEILGPRTVRIRAPDGFAVVCGTDNNGGRVGVVSARGRWMEGMGDSVLVERASGSFADRLDRLEPGSDLVPCLTDAPGMIVRLDQRVPDAVAGSVARSFRSQILESVTLVGSQWLYRVDGGRRDLVAGPLDAAEGFRAWYEDLQGVEVADPADAHRVAVRVIARAPDIRGRGSVLRDTVLLRFGGRNP